jgi:hypothetical protein
MTEAANHNKTGMRGIEMATSAAVRADVLGVFDYSAQTSYAGGPVPPAQIVVTVVKIWPPGAALPKNFPSVPYLVINV